MDSKLSTLYKILRVLPANSCQISMKAEVTYSSVLKIIILLVKMNLINVNKETNSDRVKAIYILNNEGKIFLNLISRVYKE